jgi:DegV family protein with EDD domain
MKIKITADSTCDLSRDLVEKHDIAIIPLYVVMDDKPYKDTLEISPAQIFDYVTRTGKTCHTSAINVEIYKEEFAKYADSYDAVIHVNLSSYLSVGHQNAKLAAESFDNVYVVDSLNLSTGSGHLVLDAAIMAENGSTAQEIVDYLNGAVSRVETSFILDTLYYIYKGGRCSGVAALGANLLRLKPCIEVVDGKMQVGKKYRGSLEKSLEEYVHDRLSDRDDIDYKRIFITHTLETDVMAKHVEDAVRKYGKFEEVYITNAGCTIANHCGPNCCGILFYRNK